MSTFQVMFKMRENDAECRHLGAVLRAVCGHPRRLGGSGGYLRDMGADEIASLCMQKNDPESHGALDCTEDDRCWAEGVLRTHPNVVRFLVGPIEANGRTFGQMDRDEEALLKRFLASEPN